MVCLSIRMGKLKIKYKGKFKPVYQTVDAAGADLCSANVRSITLNPGEYKSIPTGLVIEIPKGYEGQVRPRSGLAKKFGIGILNGPGTIDADYRGQIEVILFNISKRPFKIKPKMRIAQLVINRTIRARYVPVSKLKKTRRASGGFGHTGI